MSMMSDELYGECPYTFDDARWTDWYDNIGVFARGDFYVYPAVRHGITLYEIHYKGRLICRVESQGQADTVLSMMLKPERLTELPTRTK